MRRSVGFGRWADGMVLTVIASAPASTILNRNPVSSLSRLQPAISVPARRRRRRSIQAPSKLKTIIPLTSWRLSCGGDLSCSRPRQSPGSTAQRLDGYRLVPVWSKTVRSLRLPRMKSPERRLHLSVGSDAAVLGRVQSCQFLDGGAICTRLVWCLFGPTRHEKATRRASSKKAITCSRRTDGKPRRNSSMESPASR